MFWPCRTWSVDYKTLLFAHSHVLKAYGAEMSCNQLLLSVLHIMLTINSPVINSVVMSHHNNTNTLPTVLP